MLRSSCWKGGTKKDVCHLPSLGTRTFFLQASPRGAVLEEIPYDDTADNVFTIHDFDELPLTDRLLLKWLREQSSDHFPAT